MGKLQNGMNKKTKKEKKFDKVKNEYSNLSLSREDFLKIPQEKRNIYLYKKICKKYDIKHITFECEICATSVAFDDAGYITDEELLDNEHVKLDFKHK